MKKSVKLVLAGLICSALIPAAALAQSADRELSAEEIQALVEKSRADGLPATPGNIDVDYLGNTGEVVDTVYCCSDVIEDVSEEVRVEEKTTYVDALAEREVIQPVEKTLIQPVERRIPKPTSETVTNDTIYQEEYLPARIEADETPRVNETVVVEEEINTVEEVSETYYDVVGQRDIIQPVEKTIIVPVERRVVRPRTETIMAQPRYETVTETTRVVADPMPKVRETVTPRVTTETVEEVTETYVPYVASRTVIQPVEKTIVQPVDRRVLRPQSETITAPARYEKERLAPRVETLSAPPVKETITEEVTERVVYEVQDVYVDQVEREIIQPVVITRVQPVEYVKVRPTKETVTAPVIYETEYLAGRVEDAAIPKTVVTVKEDVRTKTVEEVSETYFDAVTDRTVIQPVVVTQVQPVEIRRPRSKIETVTAPTRYETVRASGMTIAEAPTCGCAGQSTTVVKPAPSCDCDCDSGTASYGASQTAIAGTTRDGRRFLTW